MTTIADNANLWNPPVSVGPSTIVFTWQFVDEHDQRHVQSATVQLGDGDPTEIIDHVRENHGMYLPIEGENGFRFLPWPPSSVRIDAG